MKANQRATLAGRYQSDGMAMSSPQKLVVLMFERIRSDLETAAAAIAARSIEGAHIALLNAQDLVFELQMALDDDAWEGATDLRSIYDYLIGLLVEANVGKSAALVERCLEVVTPLAETWSVAYQRVQQELTVAAAR
ncbi:MAG: flagellar export chaperone FliS [Acidimicrobiales bacterium]